jgi:hypothetical protein
MVRRGILAHSARRLSVRQMLVRESKLVEVRSFWTLLIPMVSEK